MPYDVREVTHGDAWAAFAPLTNGVPGAAVTLTGLRAVSIAPEENESTFYADNVPHITLAGSTIHTGTITLYQIPQSFLTGHLGKKVSENGGLTDTGIRAPFALQYVETVTSETGEEYRVLHAYYSCTAGAPTSESTTDEDAVTPKEFSIPITAKASSAILDEDGKGVTHYELRETTAATTAIINAAINDGVLITPDYTA